MQQVINIIDGEASLINVDEFSLSGCAQYYEMSVEDAKATAEHFDNNVVVKLVFTDGTIANVIGRGEQFTGPLDS